MENVLIASKANCKLANVSSGITNAAQRYASQLFWQLPLNRGANPFSGLSYNDIFGKCGFELIIDTEVSINWLNEAPETYYLCPESFVKESEDFVEYRYGFNGQERTDEIKGKGKHYTAEYWEMDPRIVKRWNPDPVVKAHESPYAVLANNPIWFIDPTGADTCLVDNFGNSETVGIGGADLEEYVPHNLENKFEVNGNDPQYQESYKYDAELLSSLSISVNLTANMITIATQEGADYIPKYKSGPNGVPNGDPGTFNRLNRGAHQVAGILGTADNSYQSYQYYKEGDKKRAEMRTTLAFMYAAGTVLSFAGLPYVGIPLIAVTGIFDAVYTISDANMNSDANMKK